MLDKKLFFFALISLNSCLAEKKIYFAPVCKSIETDRPYIRLMRIAAQKLGYSFVGADSPWWPYPPVLEDNPDWTAIIYFNSPTAEKRKQIATNIPKHKRYLCSFEPPIHDAFAHSKDALVFFNKIITWNDLVIDNNRYFKGVFRHDFSPVTTKPFAEKKLCCMIAGYKKSQLPNELYSERIKAIKFFNSQHPQDFDLYGYQWPKTSYIHVNRGTVSQKIATLQQYKFCICYENSKKIYGYVTEKIIDCLQAGCVPIYWGATNITDYIPQDCFIDRTKFNSLEDLYVYIKNMSEAKYNRYIAAAHTYMAREHNLFSHLFLADSFLQALIPEYKPELVFDTQQATAIHALRAAHDKIQKKAKRLARNRHK